MAVASARTGTESRRSAAPRVTEGREPDAVQEHMRPGAVQERVGDRGPGSPRLARTNGPVGPEATVRRRSGRTQSVDDIVGRNAPIGRRPAGRHHGPVESKAEIRGIGKEQDPQRMDPDQLRMLVRTTVGRLNIGSRAGRGEEKP